MKNPIIVALSFILCLVVYAHGQLILNTISSASVQDWTYVPTAVDTVLVETQVSNGVAATTLTMVLKPQLYQEYNSIYIEDCSSGTCIGNYIDDPVGMGRFVDSLEISSTFWLPTDWLVQDMHLWIGGQKVRAAIQDVALARGQYEEIVNRRLDPCLLEYHGNSEYSMHIFPTKSLEARKVQIQFQHTFDDDSSDVITACIPIIFDNYNWGGSNIPIGYMKLSISSADDRLYGFDMPGLGSGNFSSVPLVLEKSDITFLAAGTVYAADPSLGKEYLWSGPDKNNKTIAGFSFFIAESTVTRGPEPETRIIVIDMRNEMWDGDDYWNAFNNYYSGMPDSGMNDFYSPVHIWKRAQKLAVLCLKNYVNENHKFNVLIAGTSVSPVFESPVKGTVENLFAAGLAIAQAQPNADASTEAALQAAISQADGGVVVLISDLMRPYNYVRGVFDADGLWIRDDVSVEGNNFNSLMANLSAMAINAGINLFTIEDEWIFSEIAYATGGFQISQLRNDGYAYYDENGFAANQTIVINGITFYIPRLPKLFSGWPSNTLITGLKVESDQFTDIAWSDDVSCSNFASFGFLARERSPMHKQQSRNKPAGRAKMILPFNSSIGSTLRVAGVFKPDICGRNVEFKISGKLGGLPFTKTLHAEVGTGSGIEDNDQWAFRKSEHLFHNDWYNNASTIKALGRDYHIVTRQTSLLALEPGVDLWEDNTGLHKDASENQVSETNSAVSGSQYSGVASISLDSISLEDLVNGLTPTLISKTRTAVRTLSAAMRGTSIKITLPESFAQKSVTVTLFDVRGRLVASRTITPAEAIKGEYVWNMAEKKLSIANAQFILKVRVGGRDSVLRLPVMR